MSADIILGVNIDTLMWISSLKKKGCKNIVIVDYCYSDELVEKSGVTYISPYQAKVYINNFDSISYYKSIYIYPGMRG